MNYSAYVILIIVAGGLAILYLQHRQRTSEIDALAKRLGFHYLGKGTPKSLTLDETGVAGVSSIWNVIDGEHGGVRLIIFDCRIGMGRRSWRRTVLAAETTEDGIFPNSARPLVLERSGRWLILYQPRQFVPPGLMPIAEIEAYVNAIAIRSHSSTKGLC